MPARFTLWRAYRFSFRRKQTTVRIIAFGDIHMHLASLTRIDGLEDAELVLLTGDLTNFGHRGEAAEVLEAVRAINANVLAVHGNLDYPEVKDYLEEQKVSLHGRGLRRGDVHLVGVGGSNPTPFHTPSEYSENELARTIEQGVAELKGHLPFILVSHPPPSGCAADRLKSGLHVGSSAVRRCIVQYAPSLCLCGHIHEARSETTVGSTRVINPGLLRDGGWIEINLQAGTLDARLCGIKTP